MSILSFLFGQSDHDRLVKHANELSRKWVVIKADNAVEVNYRGQDFQCVAHEEEPVWDGKRWKSTADSYYIDGILGEGGKSFYIGNIANVDPQTWEIRR